MGSSAPRVKLALLAELEALYAAPVQVVYGPPGPDQEDDIVCVGNARSNQDLATMSPQRRREETLDVDVIVSCYRGGGTESQQSVTERAYALLADLEDHLQGAGYDLGGVVRLARVTSHELVEAADPDVLAKGRVSEITAVVTCHVRI